MTDTKFIADLKSKGYVEGDLSTLPSDTSDADRRKAEQHEADLANERMKAFNGEKPKLGTYHVELNPNQYGYAERAEADGDVDADKAKEDKPKPEAKPETKRDPLDHDNNGRKSGVADNK